MYQPRGIEHIGMTVPDIEQAERFFIKAFGAETLYSLVTKGEEPQGPADMHKVNGLLPGTAMISMRMMRLGNGPNIELFEISDSGEGRKEAAGINDRGLHHFSIYVDDIEAAAKAFTDAGGIMTDGPVDLFRQEGGEGNQCWFGRFPWGTWLEIISFPSGVKSISGADRWKPDATSA